jgi:hypothetical protein
MIRSTWSGALLLILIAHGSLFAQKKPHVFGQIGIAATGSTIRPFPPPGPWGYTKPRLFPTYGGGYLGGPIVNIGFGSPFYGPPVYAQPIVVSNPSDIIEIVPNFAVEPNVPPIVGQPAGRFRPVGPVDRDRARMAQPIAARPAPPPENPQVAYDRLMRDGIKAFGMGEYGRAMELFKKATATLPDDADAYFALAQAWIALGKYADASIAIHTGLRIDPKWAADGPPMILLYGNRRFDFEQHRRALVDASEAFPADITLQFGRAYFEWFDAERDAARLRFEDLRPIVADAAIIDLFLAEP